MKSKETNNYTVKLLRSLCNDIYDEKSALLLQSTLAEFPVSVVDDYFKTAKLNNPSGPDEREWADMVRLALISFSPLGSEPAKLRGKPLDRFIRANTLDPRDQDQTGILTLYPTIKTTPLLPGICEALGVKELKIRSIRWLGNYVANPFHIETLEVRITDICDNDELEEFPLWNLDLDAIVSVLPERIENFMFHTATKIAFSGSKISRLKCLKKLEIEVSQLPQGLNFSENTNLERIDLTIWKGGSERISGLKGLSKLISLVVNCYNGFVLIEPLDAVLQRPIEKLSLNRVEFESGQLCGTLPSMLQLGTNFDEGIKGLNTIKFERSPSKVSYGYTSIRKAMDLETIDIKGCIGDISIEGCDQLISANVECLEDSDLLVADCPKITSLAVKTTKCCQGLVLKNLPNLSDAILSSPEYEESSSRIFSLINTGLTKLPVFRGEWKGLKQILLDGNAELESILGIEALPDLAEIHIKNHSIKRRFFPENRGTKNMGIRAIFAENLMLASPIGFEHFPNIEKLGLVSCEFDSIVGIEQCELLQSVDFSSSSIASLSALVDLTNLKSLKLSGCERLRPKPPRVLLEGPQLFTELVRHARPNQTIKNKPSEELLKLVDLIGAGSMGDVKHALQLLPALSPEERAKLVKGCYLDAKSGWFCLPYLAKIDASKSRGMAQLRILEKVDSEESRALLASVTEVRINKSPRNSTTTISLGVHDNKLGKADDILEEVSSLGSLPALPNVSCIEINGHSTFEPISHFSLEGVGQFKALKSLSVNLVDKLENVSALAELSGLERLYLSGDNLKNLEGMGTHSKLKHLVMDCKLDDLRGLEKFPALESIDLGPVADISMLFAYATARKCRLSFGCNSNGKFKEYHPNRFFFAD